MGDGFMHDSKLPLYLMATLSTVLVLYNFIAVCFRSRPPPDSGGEGEGEGEGGGGGGGGPSSSAEESSAAANAGAAGHVNVTVISDLIPAHKYSKSLSGIIVGDEDDGGGGAACAVCLGEFEEGDELRTLPECLHSFHAACIDLWLFKHPNCPICRADQLTH